MQFPQRRRLEDFLEEVAPKPRGGRLVRMGQVKRRRRRRKGIPGRGHSVSKGLEVGVVSQGLASGPGRAALIQSRLEGEASDLS